SSDLAKKAIYIDSFTQLEEEIAGQDRAITDNGIHLNGFGHWKLSQILIDKLRLMQHSPGSDFDSAEAVRGLVQEKNRRNREAPAAAVAEANQLIWEADKPSMTSIWSSPPEAAPAYIVATRPLQFQESTLTRVALAKESMKVAHGLSVDLWVSEEEAPVMYPIQMKFDGRGRLWVLCSSPNAEDYLVVIEDIDRDHFADRSTIFARDLANPKSFVISAEGAIVAEDGALVEYRDKNGDGAADGRRQLMAGFGKKIGGLSWGPGGGLWFGQGKGSESRLETVQGPLTVSDGAMFRFDPRRIALDLITEFDFAEAPALMFDGWEDTLVADTNKGRTYLLNHLIGQERDDEMRSVLTATSRKNPGGDMLRTRHFPPGVRDAYVHHEAGAFNGVRWYRRWQSGSSLRFEGRPQHVFSSSDEDFQPVDTEIGPDGALYVIDSNGRVWRIGAFGRREFWRRNLSNVAVPQLLEQLREFEEVTRQLVRQEIWRRDPEIVIPALQSFIDTLSPDDPNRQQLLTEALWLHQAFDEPNEALLDRLSGSPEPRARAVVANVLGYWADQLAAPLELLTTLMEDPDPRVRLSALQAAFRIDSPQAGDVALLAERYSMDLALKSVFSMVSEKLGKAAGVPESVRAAAVAKATPDLVKEEMTPIVADVLLERADVPNDHLLRAAAVTARNRNQTMTRVLIDVLSDDGASEPRQRNVLELMRKADAWELHYATTELTVLVEATANSLAREGAYAGLMLAAATSDTFDRFLEEVKRREDFHQVAMLRASAHVLSDDRVAAKLTAGIRDQLAKTDGEMEKRRTARFVRVYSRRATQFRFAELEVLNDGKNIAANRPAKQLAPAGDRTWWASNARAGTNGITKPELETAHQPDAGTGRPILGVNVAGSAAADEDVWWEVDLGGRGAEIEEIVFYPTANGCETSLVHFEIRDARGQLVWRTSRPQSNTKPIRVPVHLDEEIAEAAGVAANALGDEFRKRLVETAETDDSMDARFAAMRALNRMGSPPEHLKIQSIDVQVSEQLKLAPAKVAFDPKTPVELTFKNGNGHPLNIAILEPESEAEVGELVQKIANGESEDEDGIPNSAKILFASTIVASGESTILRFVAPTKPGDYPMLSTTPDGWEKMRGALTVKAPPPPPEPEPKPEPDEPTPADPEPTPEPAAADSN
ncbi:MAG: HEAT repeat domain-containing protein, partial [Verrucomicrobiota bacterium]